MQQHTKYVVRGVLFVGLWIFLVWLGWSAVEYHTEGGDFLLSIYVLLAATGVSALFWRATR